MTQIKLALRTLFKSPFVTLVAVVSLALGIGANAATFSLLYQVLLRPLPVHEPERLVNWQAPGPKPGSQSCDTAGDCDYVFSYPMFRDLKTMSEQVKDNTFVDRMVSTLSAAFAALARVLAAIGLYPVLAYNVSQRRCEIGLRMALGTDGARVRRLVLRQVGWMSSLGVMGVAAALALGRLARSLLFEVEGHDPVVLVSAVVLLAVIALDAGFIPAQSASRIDPMRALRYE